MINNSVLLYACYLVCCFAGVLSQSCNTPRQERGTCIPLRDCSQLFKLVQQQPVSQENVDYLRKSQCGFEGNHPKVCCSWKNGGQPGNNKNLLPGTDVCGNDPSDRIVGGVQTTIREFAWVALLQYEKPTGLGFHCGGSLINNRYVLTAAHCTKRIPRTWKLISVRLGEHQLDTDPDCADSRPGFLDCADSPVDIPVEEVIVYDEYIPNSPSQTHDIALLRLSRPVAYTEFIAPICLPSASHPQIPYYGVNMTVSGWGRTETRGQSNIKRKLEVPVKHRSVCVSTYSTKANVNLGDGQICAGGLKGQDSCKGDSGGPLMYLNKVSPESNWYLTGVVSLGPRPCGIKEWPSIYTKVVHYAPWIHRNLRT